MKAIIQRAVMARGGDEATVGRALCVLEECRAAGRIDYTSLHRLAACGLPVFLAVDKTEIAESQKLDFLLNSLDKMFPASTCT